MRLVEGHRARRRPVRTGQPAVPHVQRHRPHRAPGRRTLRLVELPQRPVVPLRRQGPVEVQGRVQAERTGRRNLRQAARHLPHHPVERRAPLLPLAHRRQDPPGHPPQAPGAAPLREQALQPRTHPAVEAPRVVGHPLREPGRHLGTRVVRVRLEGRLGTVQHRRVVPPAPGEIGTQDVGRERLGGVTDRRGEQALGLHRVVAEEDRQAGRLEVGLRVRGVRGDAALGLAPGLRGVAGLHGGTRAGR